MTFTEFLATLITFGVVMVSQIWAVVWFLGNRLEDRMDRFGDRMDRFENRMDRFEDRMDRLDESLGGRMDRLEGALHGLREDTWQC